MWKGVAYMHAITYNLDRQTDRLSLLTFGMI